MKFIHLETKGEKSHYINVSNITFVHNNNGLADIYVAFLDEPIKSGIKYQDVIKLIVNAPNF